MTEQIENQIITIVDAVENGNANAGQAYVMLKKLSDIIKDSMDQIKPEAHTAFSRFGEKNFSAFGAKIQMKNEASKWIYKGCTLVEETQKKLKLYQELSQKASETKEEIYDSSGIRIEPAVKIEGGETFAISFK
jgi:2-polyprenyl-3-methyl-5-hydroxy-6-metoxy-1,4-benzoquinol methylase